MSKPSSYLALGALLALLGFGPLVDALEAEQGILVNGEPVLQADFERELARYGLPMTAQVPDGDYWYDRFSGLWGMRGGPTMGQMPPEMNLGGALQANTSAEGTGVFINGRELHPTEVLYLQQLFGYAIPGRYWMNAFGIGGFEGGPPIFNMMAAAQSQAGGSYTRRGLFGSSGSDGKCSYYMTPGGSSVMTGNC